MALVKYGALISEARGKEGGIVFSRNSYGGYVKQKVSPVNPQKPDQQYVRALLGTAAQQWSGLTQEQRDEWKQAGQQILRVNRFGDQTYHTGFNLFVKCNRNRVMMGQAVIDTPPSVPSIPTLHGLTPSASVDAGALASCSLAFTLTGGEPATEFKIVIDATPPIITGRRFVKNFYRNINVAPAQTSPANLLVAYAVKFTGAAREGDYIGFRARLVHIASGLDGPYATGGCIVEAA